jgi:hypothetical protein
MPTGEKTYGARAMPGFKGLRDRAETLAPPVFGKERVSGFVPRLRDANP